MLYDMIWYDADDADDADVIYYYLTYNNFVMYYLIKNNNFIIK